MDDDIVVSLLNNKGVIVSLLGGLGNQMFEIAAGYALAKNNNVPLYLGYIAERIKCNNKHNKNNNNYNRTIFNYFIKTDIRKVESNIYNKLTKNGYIYKDIVPSYANIKFPPNIKNNGILLNGRFQNYNLFCKYENEIRNLFVKGLETNINKMKYKYNTENTAFLHVRRGDYLLLPNLFKQASMKYYIKCINRLKNRNKDLRKIFIFSNDINYIKSKPFFNKPIFKIINENDELDTLALMYLCKAGAIITNSTFGWWGAFLGAYSVRNPVFAFKQWILTTNTPHLCPKEYNRI